jgi:hypothetical protein
MRLSNLIEWRKGFQLQMPSAQALLVRGIDLNNLGRHSHNEYQGNQQRVAAPKELLLDKTAATAKYGRTSQLETI